jgi:hypothetical protein
MSQIQYRGRVIAEDSMMSECLLCIDKSLLEKKKGKANPAIILCQSC